MENTILMRRDLDDIVFEYRNRAYGAYLLRKSYGKHIRKASFFGTTFFLLLLISPLIIDKINNNGEKELTTVVTICPPPPPEQKKIVPPPPPKLPKPEPPKIRTTGFVPPKVKEDIEVKELVIIPPMDSIKGAVSTKTQEGEERELPPTYSPPPTPPVGFDDKGKEEEVKPVEPDVFIIVEQKPEFPDGELALYKFLQKNVRYPDVARENNIQGTVYIAFVVGKNGSISNVEVKRGIGGGCNEEAIRVIKLMPNWQPGKQNGRTVNVAYTLPIKFKLD